MNGGFWFPVTPGDSNEDGLVTLVDYASLAQCMSGPDATIEPGCENFDLNNDGTIDMADGRLFQLGFTGQ